MTALGAKLTRLGLAKEFQKTYPIAVRSLTVVPPPPRPGRL